MVVINLTNSVNNILLGIVNEIKRYINNSNNMALEIENSINAKEKSSEYVIDRFEGEIAVCESINDNKIISIKKENLPINVREGNVLKYDGNKYTIDFEKSSKLKNDIQEITKDLWKN